MNFHTHLFRGAARGLVVLGLVLAVAAPRLALAQADPRAFSDTGFTIADDTIWSFFNQFGGTSAFGAPISREFPLFGKPTQLFQNAALQVQPDGSWGQQRHETDADLAHWYERGYTGGLIFRQKRSSDLAVGDLRTDEPRGLATS